MGVETVPPQSRQPLSQPRRVGVGRFVVRRGHQVERPVRLRLLGRRAQAAVGQRELVQALVRDEDKPGVLKRVRDLIEGKYLFRLEPRTLDDIRAAQAFAADYLADEVLVYG